MEAQPWSIRLDDENQGTGVQVPVPGAPAAAAWAGPVPLLRRPGTAAVLAAVLTVVLIAVDNWVAQPTANVAIGGTGQILPLDAYDRPTATSAPSRLRLGAPIATPPDAGPYAFMLVHPGTNDPVTYDPCRPLPYVMNLAGAPPGADQLIADAVAVVEAATGLQFHNEGLTDEPVLDVRAPFQPDRYGDRWAPILMAWAQPERLPALEGDVAGLAGSIPVAVDGTPGAVYVSGVVALDAPQLTELLAVPNGTLHVRSVILHELGHLVGLDHVEDATQLMHPWGSAFAYREGDLAGLARLGAGPCIPRL